MAEETEVILKKLDTEIQNLLNKIKTAQEGHIITSDYHNSLRDTLEAIARRVGITVKPASESKIFTLAPNFLPINQRQPRQFDWKVTFNKAAIPGKEEEGPQIKGDFVLGAFLVQLPDKAQIRKMTLRGNRDGDEENPVKFLVTLNRREFDDEDANPEVLITFDWTLEVEIQKETQELKSPKLGQVDNTRYQYYVEAEWVNAGDSDRFEINSLQVFCE
jgi:hypothetical protein